MIDEIALHCEELKTLCRRLDVRRREPFGPAACGSFDAARR